MKPKKSLAWLKPSSSWRATGNARPAASHQIRPPHFPASLWSRSSLQAAPIIGDPVLAVRRKSSASASRCEVFQSPPQRQLLAGGRPGCRLAPGKYGKRALAGKEEAARPPRKRVSRDKPAAGHWRS